MLTTKPQTPLLEKEVRGDCMCSTKFELLYFLVLSPPPSFQVSACPIFSEGLGGGGYTSGNGRLNRCDCFVFITQYSLIKPNGIFVKLFIIK